MGRGATEWPAAASASATPAPRPRPPPVTSATGGATYITPGRPASRFIGSLIGTGLRSR